MTNDEAELARLRALVTRAGQPTECPPAELLARVAAGEADTHEHERVVDHLAICSTCSDEYRVAASLGDWARRASQDLNLSETVAPAATRPPIRAWTYLAAAVVLGGVIAAFTAWNWSLREENARLGSALRDRGQTAARPPSPDAVERESQAKEAAGLQARLDEALAPAANTPIIDLLPRDNLRGSSTDPTPRIPSGARQITFVITIASQPSPRDHELEIIGASGEVLWRGGGLRPNAERAFTVTVPRALLRPGLSRLNLYAPQKEGPKMIAEYAVRVEP